MKDVHRKLFFEMLSNSRRSDRELAKFLRTSQPTVTRARRWLETNGFIMEYTLIPDFAKIGFELMVFTFFRIHVNNSKERREEMVKRQKEFMEIHPNVIAALRGEGMGCDGIILSLHKNFADFIKFIRELKTQTVETEIVGNFIASLDAWQYRRLTFKHLKKCTDKPAEDII